MENPLIGRLYLTAMIYEDQLAAIEDASVKKGERSEAVSICLCSPMGCEPSGNRAS